MRAQTPEAIVASLDERQREIVLWGPSSFAEADAIPDDLFNCDVDWDRETGDESVYWIATDLGAAVRALLMAD